MAKKTVKKVNIKVTKKDLEKASTKSTEELRFEIDQLRKEKMIYSLESIATTLAALLFLISISIYFPRINVRTYYNLGFTIALGYWLLTVLINIGKHFKIKKLEKELNSK